VQVYKGFPHFMPLTDRQRKSIALADFSPGGLEHLLRLVKGMEHEILPGPFERMRADVRAELDARYARIEAEVPGWKR
jgi:hypothetical protein